MFQSENLLVLHRLDMEEGQDLPMNERGLYRPLIHSIHRARGVLGHVVHPLVRLIDKPRRDRYLLQRRLKRYLVLIEI
jgi:hypothetical protein